MALGSTILEGVLYGLSLGMLYVLVALGLTLIFGMMNVINFAHGAFVTAGAYLGFTTLGYVENFWVGLLVATVLVGGLGVVIERLFLKRLYDTDHIYQLLLTFGLALVIEGLIILRYGTGNQRIAVPELFDGAPISIASATIPQYRLFLVAFTAVLVVLVWYGLQRTRIGLVIKAGIEDRERTELHGIRLNRINMLIMGVGSGFAAMAGYLAGPLFRVHPHLGTDFLIISFVVVVIGGLGSLMGAIVTGLLIGVLYSVMQFLVPGFAQMSVFVAMIVILIVRPQGLFGGSTA